MPRSVDGRARLATREVLLVAAALAAVLLALAGRYGPHRDELYFAAAGRHLAWGYPDQPVLTPLLARLTTLVAGDDLVVLRLPSLLAVCALVLLSAAFARLLGAARAGQVLTAVVVATSAITVTLGHRLSTATFDTLAWTAILLVVAHALVDERPRLWVLAGVIAGVGLNNKNSVAIVMVGILVAVLASRDARRHLRTPYPWLGAALAVLMWLPDLVWQARHGWPELTLGSQIADESAGLGGRLALVGQLLVMFSPVIAVLWIYGLVALLRRPRWRAVRPVALTFLLVLGFFLLAGGKGYYLAGLIPPLIAAGCTDLAERWATRRVVVAGAVLALSAIVAWPALVPVLPVRTYTASFYPAIDADQPETIGWPELVATVRRTIAALPADQRRTSVVFTLNYGEAGALEWYDVGHPVYSGHNAWALWGPPPGEVGPVVVVGWSHPEQEFTGCRRTATIHNAEGADNEEDGHGVWVCRAPRTSWAAQWPELSHLDA